MKIYMAVIDHEYGMNFYADTTPEGVKAQVYEWVKEYWEQLPGDDTPIPEDHQEAIDDYFDHWSTLALATFGDQILPEPDPVEIDRNKLWAEFAVYHQDNEALMNKIGAAIEKMADTEVSYAVGNFEEVTYDGDAGCDFLNDLLAEFGIDPDDYGTEEDDV